MWNYNINKIITQTFWGMSVILSFYCYINYYILKKNQPPAGQKSLFPLNLKVKFPETSVFSLINCIQEHNNFIMMINHCQFTTSTYIKWID